MIVVFGMFSDGVLVLCEIWMLVNMLVVSRFLGLFSKVWICIVCDLLISGLMVLMCVGKLCFG